MDRNIIKGKSVIQIYPTAGQKCDIVTRQSVSDYVHLISPSRGICCSHILPFSISNILLFRLYSWTSFAGSLITYSIVILRRLPIPTICYSVHLTQSFTGQVFSFPSSFSLSSPKLSACRDTVFLDMVSTFDLHTIRRIVALCMRSTVRK